MSAAELRQLVSEGVVDGVELFSVLDGRGVVLEEHLELNDAARSCGC